MDYFSLFNYGDSSSRTSISSRIPETEDPSHSNLIQVLSTATALDVNIIPLTWRPALEVLGEGATGRISQSLMDSQISLAFKRLSRWDRSRGQSETQFRALQHKALVSETVALSCPELYGHPNIVNLEGLCWELSDEGLSPEAWPVLVFKKAQYGDLRRFFSLPEAENLEFGDRIEICREVAKALDIMHHCGIVHGDVKPENVLVGEGSEPSTFGFQMTDFGYSCYGSSDEDFVRLPRSQPWEAPEYHPRWFTLAAAKKTDIYSFGLLCLWLLFPGEVLNTHLGEINIDLAFRGDKGQLQTQLETLKQEGSILDHTLELLSCHSELDEGICSRLRSVFNLSLHLDPAERAPTMRCFVKLLCEDEVPQYLDPLEVVNIATTPSWHGNLQLEKFCFQIEACDFRVQAYIARQLLATAERTECKPCAINAAFQLALCYSFGFGVRAESDKCQYWLKMSEKNDEDLEKALESIRTMEPSIEALAQLINLGYQSELAEFYVDQGIVAEAVTEYRSMILAREQVFGSTHFSPRRMRSLLGDIFQRNNQLEEAVEIRTKEIENTLQIPGFHQSDLLVLKSKLARTLEDLGKFDKSETVRLEVLEGYSKLPNGTVGRVIALYDLSSCSLEQGKYSTAVERGQVAVDESVKVLGEDHANTLIARGILATAYFRLGETQKAIDQNEEVLQFRKQGLGMDHRDTIETLNRLALQYHNLGQWAKAKDAFGQVWKARKKSNGESSRSALLVGQKYARTIMKLGEIEEACCIQRGLLAEMIRLFGAEDQSTINMMEGLGVTYEHLRLWEEAEDLEKKVLAYRKQKLGLDHALTLQAMRNLADTFFNQKKWAEAAELGLEELEIRQSTIGKPDNTMIEVISGCARSLTYLERWAEAGPLLDLEISMRTDMDNNDDVERFEAIVLAATGHMNTQDWARARQQIAALFEASLQLRSCRKSTASRIDALAASCQLSNWLEEAEQLFVLEFLIREKFCPEDKEGFEELEKKIFQVMEMQGKSGHSINFNPKDIIAREKRE